MNDPCTRYYLTFTRKITGLALRQCIELGYHQKSRRFGPVDDDLHLQMRRRTFWCAYGIECTLALWLGRPLSLPLHDISVEVRTFQT